MTELEQQLQSARAEALDGAKQDEFEEFVVGEGARASLPEARP